MTPRGRVPPAPRGAALVAGLLAALVLRALDLAPADPAGPSLALLGFFITLGSWILQGLSVIATVSVKVLAYVVHLLWISLRVLGTGVKGLGVAVLDGFRASWKFLDRLYTNILKPAWDKFWKVIDWARAGLMKLFGPIVDFLATVRKYLLGWYDKFVRPVLDTVDVTRKVLRVFRALGAEWAKALDEKLAAADAWVSARFLEVLGKVNEAINIIDRVVTADGLFQRLALVRSIERDIRYVSRAFVNWRARTLGADDYARLRAASRVPTLDAVVTATAEGVTTGGGRYGPFIAETVAQWRLDLERR